MKLTGTPVTSTEFVKGLHDFLDCSDQLGKNELYRADAIEFTGQYIGARIDLQLNAALKANQSNDSAKRDQDAAVALDLMDDLDALMSAHPIYRLDRWTKFARSWGDTPAEKDYYESDAKRQITTWGGPDLTEYASRAWSGLIRGYYRARWEAMFKQLATGEKVDLLAWEEHWIKTPGFLPPVRKIDDPIAECKRLVAKCEQLQQ
jgi:alpha-N-acetylglucosaminidase